MKIFQLAIAATLCVVSVSTFAVRVQSTISNVVNPASYHAVADLIRNGDHFIGGGVFLEGNSAFVLESMGPDKNLNPSDVSIEYSNGRVFLVYEGSRYRYEMHTALVCPLANFIARDGRLAFSIPSDNSITAKNKLVSMGLAQYDETNIWIAKEFQQNELAWLFLGADYADVSSLPKTQEKSLIKKINTAVNEYHSLWYLLEDWDSYFNTDSMSNIITYIMKDKGAAETSGVPLRFYWFKLQSGDTFISEISIYSQTLGAEKISELSEIGLKDMMSMSQLVVNTELRKLNQIDYISAYQSAAIFRSLHSSNRSNFESFTTNACER